MYNKEERKAAGRIKKKVTQGESFVVDRKLHVYTATEQYIYDDTVSSLVRKELPGKRRTNRVKKKEKK